MENFTNSVFGVYEQSQYLPIISRGAISSYDPNMRPDEDPQHQESASN